MSSGVSHREPVMETAHHGPRFGAWCEDGAWNFRLWAPNVARVDLVLSCKPSRALLRRPDGVFVGRWADLHAGDHYWYRIDGRGPFPDPASRWQPCGVHGPSALVDPGGQWGDALNFRGEAGAMVRAFCLDNAMHWIEEYHLDGLRFDATHAYHDDGERPFLGQCIDTLRARVARPLLLIAEDDRNDAALVRPLNEGGRGLDAMWADDLHHHLRRLLAGDHDGYFASYPGTTAAIADTIEHGWYYRGQHSPHHGKPRGTATAGASLSQFVVCLQNHDQVGNRAQGDRLHHAIDLAAWRAASALLLCLPETPLLFMGQEWAAGTPFRYFTDHAGELGKAVTAGPQREFASFARFGGHDVPDPQALDTFEASKLDWRERLREPHASNWRLYRDVIAMRHTELTSASTSDVVKAQAPDEDSLVVERVLADGRVCLCVVRLRGRGPVEYLPTFGRCGGCERPWRTQCSTENAAYAGDPQPIAWKATSEGRQCAEFRRPGALILLG